MNWQQVETERGPFWTCSDEQRRDLEQVISEQRDTSGHRYETAAVFGPIEGTPRILRVEPGDVVLDLGAHLGVFTRIALDRGAVKVVAVEPDPVSCRCLRRTFEAEITAGRVVVVEAAAGGTWTRWWIGGSGIRTSLAAYEADGHTPCEVATVDAIVERLKLDRMDFVKLDIEGGETRALQGAAETIRRFKPSIACCVYHDPDDASAALTTVRLVRNDYSVTCGPVAPWMTTPVLMFLWR